tara:strand:- start:674 stop:859 length:186 start_codon:yes stop_codon:yes gene_type:complete
MRCRACNWGLSDSEAVRRDITTGEFYDLCGHCLSVVRQSQEETEIDYLQRFTGVADEDEAW